MSQLIAALDFNNQQEALNFTDKIDPYLCAVKVGSELFTATGPQLVSILIQRKFKVFLDLKFNDIPNTVARACQVAADLGVWMMNIHASAGFQAMQKAVEVLAGFGSDRPLLIAVTVLTSFNQEVLKQIGITQSILKQVLQLAHLAKQAGLDGVVSSAHEVSSIKQACGSNFIAVTPGIRLPSSARDDQSRIMTPAEAVAQGSDYLVMGRPITLASDPLACIYEALESVKHSGSK